MLDIIPHHDVSGRNVKLSDLTAEVLAVLDVGGTRVTVISSTIGSSTVGSSTVVSSTGRFVDRSVLDRSVRRQIGSSTSRFVDWSFCRLAVLSTSRFVECNCERNLSNKIS
ncbi:hypothetical protein M514_05742 [Trichuris suis]|uniref:Uncharacterized protein n=1 Tax=Trichuris suis TaxID=68888 RepID=A0A085NA47_9BILA|nr:hypothetical protein M514_05742 [Trichuris suis]